jgi:hypothetical protein
MHDDDAGDIEVTESGRQIGHDFHTLTRLPRQPDWPDCVREGFDAAAFDGLARHAADRFDRKWLQLRLGAWRRGRIVASDVTPRLLQSLDLSHCPVTRVELTHGTQCDTDWSIDRLNNGAAYAASNLAVMSVRANRAKGSLSFSEVMQRAGGDASVDGLEPIEWLRLASLMLGPSFATCQHHAPELPLCAPLPACSVRLALQQIQRLLTVESVRPSGKNRLVREFRSACASESSQQRLRALADAVHHGLKQVGDGECWDVWLQPSVMHALHRWRESLDAPGWSRAAAIAGRLAHSRPETTEHLRCWHLPSAGYRVPRSFSLSSNPR